jgi:hypothetical protein
MDITNIGILQVVWYPLTRSVGLVLLQEAALKRQELHALAKTAQYLRCGLMGVL